MTSEESAADWLRMFKTLTDPEKREEARREEERRQRREAKVLDTGLTV